MDRDARARRRLLARRAHLWWAAVMELLHHRSAAEASTEADTIIDEYLKRFGPPGDQDEDELLTEMELEEEEEYGPRRPSAGMLRVVRRMRRPKDDN